MLALACVWVRPLAAQDGPASAPSWADLADLADASQLVVRAEVKKQAELKPERAVGVAPGYTRLYIEAETIALISGSVPVGEKLRYLVDVPLDERGRAPKLRKSEVLLFARAVPSRPGEIQLVARDAQLPWSQQLEDRLRPILVALAAPDAAPAVGGVRDALSVEGNLSGESETQIFLQTATGDPVSMSVVRRPGMRPVWGVSYSEIVDQAVQAPTPQTLGWYRLACFLPQTLPGGANLSTDPAGRAMAARDYAFVIEQLGPCQRTRTPPRG
ncbi:hypothetical protein ELI_13765 [Erythrobacter litoralis HTCC2594]|uniref:Uncharacterized protein n=2 Tax=Erythrobacter litoralis TaxID=39960 RepID=Q2N646_ERYLH|nr:hypothetical protein ELI_13765 [Erythrobacter litoralis HTCC2594]